jgi:hypothetical protein
MAGTGLEERGAHFVDVLVVRSDGDRRLVRRQRRARSPPVLGRHHPTVAVA